MKLKAVDYLEWLKDREELDLWEIDVSMDAGDNMRIEELEEDLGKIRGIKKVIEDWARKVDYEQ